MLFPRGTSTAARNGHGCTPLPRRHPREHYLRWRASARRACRLLLQHPDILLLDEPTNHLDAESVAWLEHHLQSYPGTIIAPSPTIGISSTTWRADFEPTALRIPWKGNYSSWLEQKRARLATEEKQESQRQKTLERELEWIRMSLRGRHAKAKARITKYEDCSTRTWIRKASWRFIFRRDSRWATW